MTKSELMTDSECCESLSSERRYIANKGYAKVERSPRRLLNALQETAALPPDICAFGDHTSIVFGAVTDAQQRPGFPADSPWARCGYLLTKANAIRLVVHCFWLRHLVIPSSFDIRHCRGRCLCHGIA